MDSTFPFRSSSPRGRERDDLDRLRLARRLSEPGDRHALVRLKEVDAQSLPEPPPGSWGRGRGPAPTPQSRGSGYSRGEGKQIGLVRDRTETTPAVRSATCTAQVGHGVSCHVKELGLAATCLVILSTLRVGQQAHSAQKKSRSNRAVRLVLERRDGRPRQAVSHETRPRVPERVNKEEEATGVACRLGIS